MDGDDLFDMIQLLSMLTSHLEQVLPESMHGAHKPPYMMLHVRRQVLHLSTRASPICRVCACHL